MKKLLPVLLATSLVLSTSHKAEALRMNVSIDKGRAVSGIISLCSALGIDKLYWQYARLRFDYVQIKNPDYDVDGIVSEKLKMLCVLGTLASSISGVYQLYKSINFSNKTVEKEESSQAVAVQEDEESQTVTESVIF